jgi:hypothetical protein
MIMLIISNIRPGEGKHKEGSSKYATGELMILHVGMLEKMLALLQHDSTVDTVVERMDDK